MFRGGAVPLQISTDDQQRFNDCLATSGVLPSTALLEQRSRPIGQSGALPALPVEVARLEPGEERLAQGRPLGVDRGVPGRVAVAALVDRRLPEDSLERQAE